MKIFFNNFQNLPFDGTGEWYGQVDYAVWNLAEMAQNLKIPIFWELLIQISINQKLGPEMEKIHVPNRNTMFSNLEAFKSRIRLRDVCLGFTRDEYWEEKVYENIKDFLDFSENEHFAVEVLTPETQSSSSEALFRERGSASEYHSAYASPVR